MEMYETYNLNEIKTIINQVIEWEMFQRKGGTDEEWKLIYDLKIRIFDMFGIEE